MNSAFRLFSRCSERLSRNSAFRLFRRSADTRIQLLSFSAFQSICSGKCVEMLFACSHMQREHHILFTEDRMGGIRWLEVGNEEECQHSSCEKATGSHRSHRKPQEPQEAAGAAGATGHHRKPREITRTSEDHRSHKKPRLAAEIPKHKRRPRPRTRRRCAISTSRRRRAWAAGWAATAPRPFSRRCC